MKKSAFTVAALLLGVSLSGCPIYDSEADGCFDSSDCGSGYVCDTQALVCVAGEEPGPADCQRPADCGTNETCGKSGICKIGDCHFASVGCVKGYECTADSGRWECVRATAASGGEGGAAGNGTSGASGADAGQDSGGTAGAPT
jgi:hypothetical protein